MASVSKPFRLINPGRRRRKRRSNRRMTAKQIKFFGTKRQRAALRGNRSRKRNTGFRKTLKRAHKKGEGASPRVRHKIASHFKRMARRDILGRRSNRRRRARRRSNVGEILTVFNPGRSMARRRRRRSNRGLRLFRNRRRRLNRRRSAALAPVRHRRRNPFRRRRNYLRANRRRYRRNPFLGGMAGRIVGVIGGAAVTKLLTETLAGMVTFVSSGFPMYIAGAVVAFLQGQLAGKFMKSPAFGQDMQVGGYTYVALRALSDLLPSFPMPFGVSGLGLITTSGNWGPPWVPVNGSMTRFVRPGGMVAGIPAPVVTPATGMHGLGRTRRIGRLA